jgi:hypothetical protein
MNTYNDSSLPLARPCIDPPPQKSSLSWLPISIILLLVVFLVLTMLITGISTQSGASVYNQSDPNRLPSTPTVTPSVPITPSVREYFKAEWSEIRSTAPQVETPSLLGRFGIGLIDLVTRRRSGSPSC